MEIKNNLHQYYFLESDNVILVIKCILTYQKHKNIFLIFLNVEINKLKNR